MAKWTSTLLQEAQGALRDDKNICWHLHLRGRIDSTACISFDTRMFGQHVCCKGLLRRAATDVYSSVSVMDTAHA